MNLYNQLKDKKIIIGVTGSIAIYKTLELIRLFVKSGAIVRVVMSESAQKFITPLTFETISQNIVLINSSESWANQNNHISLASWGDIFIIAPATANTINKLSNGIADNLLTQTALAFDKPIIIAPSANTKMVQNHLTQASFKMLSLLNFTIVSPQKKLLACNIEGVGAMAEPIEIFFKSSRELLGEEFWKNRRVVVSGGGTVEKIDDVRFISNFSSGKQAFSIALTLYLRGADVCFISSKNVSTLPNDIHFIDVESAKEMEEFIVDSIRVAKKGVLTKPSLVRGSNPELIQKEPFLFMVAAISDYSPRYSQKGKLKKEILGDNWNLEMVQNQDIVANLEKDGIKTIIFKAETDKNSGENSALMALKNKKADSVCLNYLTKNNFGSDENEIEFIRPNGDKSIIKGDKLSVSFEILKLCEDL